MNAVEIMQQLLANAEFIDMTRIMEEGMPYWPTQPAFEAETIESQELGNESYFRKIVMCEHTGTHIDAGCHFVPGKQSVDEIPVTQIIGRALNIDATDTPACGVADVNVIKRFEKQFGSVQNGDIVFLDLDGMKNTVQITTCRIGRDFRWMLESIFFKKA